MASRDAAALTATHIGVDDKVHSLEAELRPMYSDALRAPSADYKSKAERETLVPGWIDVYRRARGSLSATKMHQDAHLSRVKNCRVEVDHFLRLLDKESAKAFLSIERTFEWIRSCFVPRDEESQRAFDRYLHTLL